MTRPAQLLKLNGINDIITIDGYTFIRVQSVIAHVFPENKCPPDEYEKFTSELVSRWKNEKETKEKE